MTIGYGVGAGRPSAFSFYVGDEYDMETGFFKLFLFQKSVDFWRIVQEDSLS